MRQYNGRFFSGKRRRDVYKLFTCPKPQPSDKRNNDGRRLLPTRRHINDCVCVYLHNNIIITRRIFNNIMLYLICMIKIYNINITFQMYPHKITYNMAYNK